MAATYFRFVFLIFELLPLCSGSTVNMFTVTKGNQNNIIQGKNETTNTYRGTEIYEQPRTPNKKNIWKHFASTPVRVSIRCISGNTRDVMLCFQT